MNKSSTAFRATVFVLCLWAPMLAQAQAALTAPGKPSWTSALSQSTDTGKFQLNWKPATGDEVDIYRLTEVFEGSEHTAYLEGTAQEFFRGEPGVFTFKLEACRREPFGVPVCSAKSKNLQVTVTEEIWAPYMQDKPVAPIAQLAVPGGPDELKPGSWFNPAKNGQGWGLYWANRLVQTTNPTNAYDLYVIWYTYEARTMISYCDGPNDTCPPLVREFSNFRPVVATMSLAKHATNNTYVGNITIRRNGTSTNVGSATVTMGANNQAATIAWNATFKHAGSGLSDTDAIQLLVGSSNTATTDISYLAGIWGSTTGSYFVVDNVGSASESVEAIFYDQNGDPTWIQAYKTGAPVMGSTDLCFYYVQGGNSPELDQAVLPGPLYTNPTCNPDLPSSSSRNGRRYFDSAESGRYWVSFTLPAGTVGSNTVAGGSLSMGTSSTPTVLAKTANFHRIKFNGANSCQTSGSPATCATTLTWFTDGAYPNASAWAYNQTTGTRSLVAVSTAPAMENVTATLSTAGTYVFELHMGSASTSTLMASSSTFTVTAGATAPAVPTGLNAVWTNQATVSYTVQWSHANTAGVSKYVLTETPPTGSVVAYDVTPGTTLSKAFSKPSGPFGTYSYRVRACNSSNVCSADTAAYTWQVTAAPQPPTITTIPAQTHSEGANVSLQVAASDPDGTVVGFTAGTSLPAGLGINNAGLISGTIAPGAAVGSPFTVTITATDNSGLTAQKTFTWTVTAPAGSTVDTFTDSFEVSEWNSLWTEDSQNDWYRSSQRATDGTWSAEVDGSATVAELISVPVDLQGATQATITFKWLIESTLDTGEYIVFETSTNGGTTWTERARLRGDVDPEDAWQQVQLNLTGISSLRLRFRGTMSASDEDANVDKVWVTIPASLAANPETPPAPTTMPSMTPDAASSRVGATAGAFRVDESGNATYSIPILTAPGSGGVAPEVALSYSSQGGNGLLGVGWNLIGLSAITRCGRTIEQDGATGTRGISLTSNDRFCLDGQRLIGVAGTYGASGAEYRTEIDGISKITSSGSAGTGPQSFTVWRKDGSVTQYGATTDSRIEAYTSTDTQTVLTWAQNRVTDSASNYINYVYSEIGGVAGQPVEFVLTRIDYTGNTVADTSPYAQIDFIYDTNRADTTLAAVAGAQVVQSQRLKRIDSKSRVSAGSSLVNLRSYHLAYNAAMDGHGRSALTSVTECNDSSQTYCFAPTTFGWQFSKHAISSSGVGVGTGLFNSARAGETLADINGDGRPDLLLTQDTGNDFQFKIALAQANGTFGTPSGLYDIPNNGLSTEPVTLHAIDLNADGFQDVIYPTSGDWQAMVSNGSTLAAAVSLGSSCCGLTDPPQVVIMDFNGDGLSDLVTQRAASPSGFEQVVLLNTFSPANPSNVSLGAPQLLTINVPPNLFPDISAPNWHKDLEAPKFENLSNLSAALARPFDYNGDGAVDLLVRLSQRYVNCDAGCSESVSGSSTQPAPLSRFSFAADSGAAEAVALSGETYAMASFYLVLLSDGGTNFGNPILVAKGDDCLVDDPCSLYPTLPIASKAWPVDINGDGLADLAWLDVADDWKVKINTGAGFFATPITVADFDPATSWQGKAAGFQDMTGDGLPDLIYPDLLNNASAKWQIRENLHGMSFASAQSTNAKFGNADDKDLSILVDFNGDGLLDDFFIDLNSLGVVQTTTTQVYLGQNSAGGSTTNAVNLVSSITDGFGAITTLTYKPLTDSSVYARMRDSKNAQWGGNSVVYDLIAPVYVVSQAASSAPLSGNATATSKVEYFYVGAKLQAGGRGFLGFGEVISYDPQSGIRTNTRYRQDFPFIGLPADTTQALVTSGQKFDPISSTSASTPVAWGTVSATTAVANLPSGTRLSYAVNQLAALETVAGKKTWFPYIVNSLERGYTLTGAFNRKVFTSNSYSGYGDLLSAAINTYEADGSTAFATQTSTHTYLAADTTNWRLGRLSTSTVTHERSGVSAITRKSGFAYHGTTGILNQEVIEPDNTTFKVTTDYALDSFGNRISATVSASGITTRSSYSTYDPLGRFVVETKNAYQQVTQKVISWDAFGNALTVDDIDGVRTTAAADYMGRPFISYTANGAWSKTVHSSSTNSNCPSSATAFYTLTTGGGKPSQYQCFDRLGRGVRSATQGFDGTMVYVDRYYDAAGRPERVSEPYFSGGTVYWNLTAYDAIGRVDAVEPADGNDMTYDYDQAASACSTSGAARQVKITNGLNQVQLELRNALGEVTAVFDNACGPVTYTYDAVGNLTQVVGVDSAVTTTAYDLAGRKTQLNDPDKGVWKYYYNPLGELTRQLDGKNQAIDFLYDLLGRVYDRRELTGTSSSTPGNGTVQNSEVTTWNTSTSTSVKGKGQITSALYRTGTSGTILHQRNYTYDSLGRPSLVTTTMDGLTLSEETTYDQFGRVFQAFDASGDDRGLRYHYNAYGYLERLREAREGTLGIVYQHIKALDQRGHLVEADLDDGSITAYAIYDNASGRLETLFAEQGLTTIQDLDYQFDVLGNLQFRHNRAPGRNDKESFSYDALNRLETVMLSANGGTTSSTTLTMQYTANGNLSNKSDVGSYQYGTTTTRPHAVTTAGSTTYLYDANGNNTSSSDGRTITYSVFDQAERLQKGVEYTEFSYGIGNQRIKRVDSNTIDQARSTWYFGSVERIVQDGGNAFFRRYVGGVAIAEYYPSTDASDLKFLLTDHLGSISNVVTASSVISLQFTAFGQRATTGWAGVLGTTFSRNWNMLISTQGFTGHEHADGLGIIHLNGRIYDPKLGRMLQADPFVQDPKNSQSLNRYSYVLNNPLSYTDPSGYFSLGKFVKNYWRVIVAAVAVYFTAGVASGWAAGWLAGTALAGNAIAIGAIAGGITGFVGGAILTGTLKGAFYGGLTGAALGGIGASGFSDFTKTVASGAAGGITNELQGGKFGHGFLSAGLGTWSGLKFGGPPNFNKFLGTAIAGGTISAVTGGKFGNGAISAGLAYVTAATISAKPKTYESAEINEALEYLNKSKSFRELYKRFQNTDATIEITDGLSEFVPVDNTILWNPTDANSHALGINSPALSLAHEMGHAVRYFENPVAFIKESESPYDPKRGLYRTSIKELRNLPFEQSVAKQLGEPIRQQYSEATGYRTNSVTFSCFAGQPGCN